MYYSNTEAQCYFKQRQDKTKVSKLSSCMLLAGLQLHGTVEFVFLPQEHLSETGEYQCWHHRKALSLWLGHLSQKHVGQDSSLALQALG